MNSAQKYLATYKNANTPLVSWVLTSDLIGMQNPKKHYDANCLKDHQIIHCGKGKAEVILKNIPVATAYNTGYLMLALDECCWICDVTKAGIKGMPSLSINLDFVDQQHRIKKYGKESSQNVIDLKIITSTESYENGQMNMVAKFQVFDEDQMIASGSHLRIEKL